MAHFRGSHQRKYMISYLFGDFDLSDQFPIWGEENEAEESLRVMSLRGGIQFPSLHSENFTLEQVVQEAVYQAGNVPRHGCV